MIRRIPRAAAATLLVLATAAPPVVAQDKPLLSAEIGSVLDRDGAQAAQARFDELFPAQADGYTVDPDGFMTLAQEYAQAGDMAKVQAISVMAAAIAQQMAFAAMPPGAAMPGAPGMPPAAMSRSGREEQRRERAAAAEAARAQSVRDIMGEPRDDLARFLGQFGDPEAQGDSPRNLFAQVRCDGYLVVGAMWGDAANWHLRSLSDSEFETEIFGGETLTISFEMGADDRPVSMTHTLNSLEPTLAYVGPLPADWEATGCIPAPGG